MKLVKLFETSDDGITEELFEMLQNYGAFSEDSTAEWSVGCLYEDTEDEQVKEFDDWLISQGAVMGENVLINHGKFIQF